MNTQGSYQIRTFASNVEKEIQRLKAQVELFWEKVLAKIAVEWRKMLKSANHSILRQLYLASGEKPLEK